MGLFFLLVVLSHRHAITRRANWVGAGLYIEMKILQQKSKTKILPLKQITLGRPGADARNGGEGQFSIEDSSFPILNNPHFLWQNGFIHISVPIFDRGI